MSWRRVIIAACVAASCCGEVLAQDSRSQDNRPQDPPGNSTVQDVAPQNAQPASPQPQSPPPQNGLSAAANAMIGAWEFSNADHDKICHFTFRADAVPGGYRLDIDKNCANFFPSTKDMTAWTVDNYGSLRLLNAGGEAVVELTEVESGMYDGFTPEEGRYILQTAAAAPIRTADDLIGNWAVARGAGKPICLLTLSRSPASATGFAVQIKPGCDALVTRFGPAAWRMDQGELVLVAPRGQTWQFEENDANTWQRVPETPDPILLVRQ